jgi:hypothetical protein
MIAFILLIFANMFLLAHSVLPHSHHDGIICFSLEEIKHRHHCYGPHDDAGGCCEHAEKGCRHSLSESCGLKDIVIRQQGNAHEEILPCSDCLSLAYTLYSLNEFYFEAPLFGERFRQKPYSENYIPPFAGSVKGLRAPPYFG